MVEYTAIPTTYAVLRLGAKHPSKNQDVCWYVPKVKAVGDGEIEDGEVGDGWMGGKTGDGGSDAVAVLFEIVVNPEAGNVRIVEDEEGEEVRPRTCAPKIDVEDVLVTTGIGVGSSPGEEVEDKVVKRDVDGELVFAT